MKLGDYLVLFVKGIIIGIGINIFSISFAVLLFVLNLYKKVIYVFSSFNNLKNNIKCILAIFLGVIVGLISGKNFINYTLNNFNMPVMIFFVGFIYGGISLFIKNIKGRGNKLNIILLLISFLFMLGINFLVLNNSSSSVIFCLLSLFVPGIGIYFFYSIDLNFLNILLLILGIIVFSKIINYLFVKLKDRINYIFLGLIMASIVMLLYNTKLSFNFVSIIMSMFTFGWGFFLSKAIDKE